MTFEHESARLSWDKSGNSIYFAQGSGVWTPEGLRLLCGVLLKEVDGLRNPYPSSFYIISRSPLEVRDGANSARLAVYPYPGGYLINTHAHVWLADGIRRLVPCLHNFVTADSHTHHP